MRLPKRVQVGPHRWTITESTGHEVDNGTCRTDLLRIEIAARLADDAKVETLLHEILHACCATNRPEISDEAEERFVAAVSPLLLDVLRRNGTVARLLIEGGD